MEGDIHYPYLNSHQSHHQSLPVSYKGWSNSCQPDRSASEYSRKFRVGEKASSSSPPLCQLTEGVQTHSAGSLLGAPMRSDHVRGHDQGAEVSYPEDFSPPV